MMATLVFGNSQIRYFYQHFENGNECDIHVISKSGLTFQNAWNQLKNLVTNYKILVLHLGYDELAKRETDEEVLSKYQTLVENIWKINPTIHIVISAIPPRGDNKFSNILVKDSYIRSINEEAMSVNQGLSAVSALIDQLHFTGHGYFMTNGCLDRSLLGRDGVHFSMSGVKTVFKSILSCVRYVSGQFMKSKQSDRSGKDTSVGKDVCTVSDTPIRSDRSDKDVCTVSDVDTPSSSDRSDKDVCTVSDVDTPSSSDRSDKDVCTVSDTPSSSDRSDKDVCTVSDTPSSSDRSDKDVCTVSDTPSSSDRSDKDTSVGEAKICDRQHGGGVEPYMVRNNELHVSEIIDILQNW
ncbi:uncharacterized protein LOC117320374 isoform X2 [Pecten maximus]|uniref:uncharacterized protein LOC117320374 isoform X2 n=1 Tax=Pecten maximus TaxID=6579 RepID=UPI0014588196|nr:uncharacterized protein LOC117320374 isoform X2 [Pecten maximus]